MPEHFKFYNPLSDKWFYALASDIAFDGQTWGAPADKLIPAELFELQQQLAEAEAELAAHPKPTDDEILSRAIYTDPAVIEYQRRSERVKWLQQQIQDVANGDHE